MKNPFVIIAILSCLAGISYPQEPGNRDTSGTFTDNRDGKVYQWVKIGTQIWMAENLAWLPQVYPPGNYSYEDRLYYVYGYAGFDTAAAKRHPSYAEYGVLYNWYAAMDGADSSEKPPGGIRGICPEGWHLPSRVEWEIMEDFPEQKGFNAKPGGFYGIDDVFWDMGKQTGFWSSTTLGKAAAFYVGFEFNSPDLAISALSKALGFYVRCVRDQ